MEKMKILIKLLKVKGQLQAANDYQAMLMDKPLAIIEEVIEATTIRRRVWLEVKAKNK